jgi:hypothetical protein
VNWALNFAASDPEHKAEWKELMTSNGIGLILRSIRTDYKFVRSDHLPTMRCCTAPETRPPLGKCWGAFVRLTC